MAQFAVSSVVKSLGDLLIQEGNFLTGVKGKVQQMQTELELMQSFLKDADKREDEDESVRSWISQIRETAYNAEDVIETFALKIASRRIGGIQSSFRRCAYIIHEAVELHRVGFEIQAITTRISNLTTSLQTYGIKPKSEGEGSSFARGMQREWRQSYAHVVEEYTVRLEGDIELLVAKLVNEKENHGVVSICGMGGLGKTTLAKMVYHHRDIRHHFDGFAWAYISQKCQRRDVWEGILFNLLSPSKEQREEIKGLRDDEVAAKLYQFLQEKKCLVILDDIWKTTAWHSLSPAFPVGNTGSKMLLTSRNKEVVPTAFIHELRCLTEEESWELLQKKAFPGKHDPDYRINANIEELGRKMVGKCAGLPLAIVVLGGVLATKHTLNDWNMVHENIISYLRRGEGHEHQYSGVSEVLALSYHELPYQLKPCFLHLGQFPEDFEIPTKKIIRMWVAEGIVSPMQYEAEREKTLEDVAQDYFDELLCRCMVQKGVMGLTGRVKTCRLHDLMRELCLSKANDENFVKIVYPQDWKNQVGSLSSTNEVRRLVIYLGEEPLKIFPKQGRTPYLRSLYFRSHLSISSFEYGPRITRKVQSKVNDFKLLKILDLEQCCIEGKLARAIGNLVHLRYLSLESSKITDLPSSIGNLRCLQTLIIKNRMNTGVRVPNVIWKMEQLRHLYLPSYFKLTICGGKLELGNLSDLQTLHRFDTRTCDVKALTKLTNLKKLRINHMQNSFKELGKVLTSSSVTFNRLCSLTILLYGESTLEEADLRGVLSCCPHLYKLTLHKRIEKLPECSQLPSKLTKLTLWHSRLEEDPMATLAKLPNLCILRLYQEAFIGMKMVCSSEGFPQLKSLVLTGLLNLVEWSVGEEAMPSLCELVINYCQNLKMVPDGLRFITTLRELKIRRMPKEFKDRLQGQEDSYIVKHVPSIIFEEIYSNSG